MIGNLPYVSALIKEVLRFYPVAPLGISHRLIADDVYKGMYLPKGSIVTANTWYPPTMYLTANLITLTIRGSILTIRISYILSSLDQLLHSFESSLNRANERCQTPDAQLNISNTPVLWLKTHTPVPGIQRPSIGIVAPLSSTALPMIKACKMEEQAMKRLFKAKYLPGQILGHYTSD